MTSQSIVFNSKVVIVSFLFNFYSMFIVAFELRVWSLLFYAVLLSGQPRVIVMSYFVFTATRDLESIDHLFINPIHRIGLIHK